MKSLNKRDLTAMLSFWIIFFLMASFNLGLHEIPSSGWKVSGDDSFNIDLNGEKNVTALLLFIKNGKINLNIFAGQPEDWIEIETSSIEDYYKWIRIDINQPTKFLKMDFTESIGEILELVVIEDDHRIDNVSLTNENGQIDSLRSLIDEQEMIVLPITYMSETIFDEVYYVRAAEEYLSGQEPYENTHPPLGKLIIASGISVFGFNPFGWRIMGVVFASSMLPIMYLLGKKIIGSWLGGLISSVLLLFEFMHFTMGRIATIDTFLVFFLLCSQLFFYNYILDIKKNGGSASLHPYFLAVFMLALGFSIKWTAMFSFAGNLFYLGYLIFYPIIRTEKNIDYHLSKIKIIKAISGTVAIFGLVYILSYIPYMNLGHSLNDVYQSQWFMLEYHSKLTATHSFSSPWWSWPLLLKPVWLYVSDLGEQWVSTITLMGNPAVWWIGLVSIFSLFEKAFKEKNPSSIYLVTIFFFQWIPFAIISRVLFLYHFYPNILFFCFSTSYLLCKLWDERKERWKVIAYIGVLIVLFGLFYPIISGNPIPFWWRDSLKWLPGWVF